MLGRIGNLYQSDDIIKNAVEKIRNGDIELSHITKTVLVIDEAQDINSEEYELIQELMKVNEEMRVIFVGDDDQNIYEFRGSDSRFMQQLITLNGAAKYELTENYRSKANIVNLANQWATTIPNRLKSEPGIPIHPGNGKISIIEYKSSNLIVPLINEVAKAELRGSTCILTKTNEEATQIVGLLIKRGFQAKLIQSNDGFNLSTIEELRFFSSLILTNEESPNISDEDLEEASRNLSSVYKESPKLSVILTIKQEFERLNTKKKYKSDWKAFIEESKLEDFISINTETIYVSTIHKAKGKEFDNVYLMLNAFKPDTNENKKQVYVAITRPKNNLSIHCNGDYFRQLKAEDFIYRNDPQLYLEPEQIVLQLNHKQVILDHFINLQDSINQLKSGGSLAIKADGLGNDKATLIKFSKAFRDLLDSRIQKGYRLSSAKINFIVYWKKPETDLEIK